MFFDERKLFALDKKTARECKIYAMLNGERKKDKLSFHTPGHKIVGYDITELDFSDNLSCPNGCILQTQQDVAKLLGADKSFLLTDGSTSGVLAMLYAAKSAGVGRLAVHYSSHKSVFNGCKLLGLQPVVFGKRTLGNIPVPPTRDEMNDCLLQADALFLTSPTYYGDIADLAFARQLCDKQNKLLLVDGAHGGHLHFDKEKHAGSFADMWVDGVHKSLPALTQGSVVSAKNERLSALLREGVDVFRTTSPSYPIMASIEFAVKFPRNERLEKQVDRFKKQYPAQLYQNQDYTKLCALVGRQGERIKNSLQKQGIYAEFFDGKILMFYLSPATKQRDFAKLQKALIKEFLNLPMLEEEHEKSIQQRPAPYLLGNEGREWLAVEQAIGRICAKPFGLFPPCIALALDGERIEECAIERLRKGDNVFGVENGKVLVYQTRE